jgi:hypothetical protein
LPAAAFWAGARPDWEFERDGDVTHLRPDARFIWTETAGLKASPECPRAPR